MLQYTIVTIVSLSSIDELRLLIKSKILFAPKVFQNGIYLQLKPKSIDYFLNLEQMLPYTLHIHCRIGLCMGKKSSQQINDVHKYNFDKLQKEVILLLSKVKRER